MKSFFSRLSRITLEDWLEYHPYSKEVSSDHFYIRLCNDIQHEIFHIDVNDHLVGADYKHLSCMLVCYFEDISSQTGVWASFIDSNRKLYDKYLPFYDTKNNYTYGDINLVDIQFLIWHFCSNLSIQNHLIDPFSLENEEMALIAYNILDEESGQAPRNDDLRNTLVLTSNSPVQQIKLLMDYFFFKSYLNYYYMTTRMEEVVLELKSQKGVNKKNLDEYIFDKHTALLFNDVSPLLALRSNELLANWLDESHPQHQTIMSISKRKKGSFLYKSTNSSHIQMEHIVTGIMVDINKTSAPNWVIPLISGQTIVQMGIVQWGSEWLVMGAVYYVDNPTIPESEKYLFAPLASQMGILEKQEECFLEANNGKRLAFFDNKKDVFALIDKTWHIYHQKYGAESMDRKLFDVHSLTFDVDDDLANLIVFFNPNTGMEFYPDIAEGISAKGNPYYDSAVESDIENFLMDDRISSEFVAYLIKSQMIEIEPISGQGGFQYIWNNCDFLLRYWKKERYKGTPKMFVE